MELLSCQWWGHFKFLVWVSCALVLTLWEPSLNEGHLELANPISLQAFPHSSQ